MLGKIIIVGSILAIYLTNGKNEQLQQNSNTCKISHFPVSKQTIKVQFSLDVLGNSIFCIKCENAYFNARASREKGRDDIKEPRIAEGEPRFLVATRSCVKIRVFVRDTNDIFCSLYNKS